MFNSNYNKEFYNNLTIEFGTTDVELTRNFYHSLVRLVKKYLKTKGFIKLPGLANIVVYLNKGRRYMNVNTRIDAVIKPHKSVKMKPNFTLRKEIREYYKNEG